MRRSLRISCVVAVTALIGSGGALAGLGTAGAASSGHGPHGHRGAGYPGHHGRPGHPLPMGHGQALVLDAALAPSVPGDTAIFGVAAGGLPWIIKSGHVRIGKGGMLELNVTGLVLSSTGVNPLTDLAASVYCAGSLAATTAAVPFSSAGDAHIHATLSLPALCAAPAVLVNPAPSGTVSTAAYIAFDGTA